MQNANAEKNMNKIIKKLGKDKIKTGGANVKFIEQWDGKNVKLTNLIL